MTETATKPKLKGRGGPGRGQGRPRGKTSILVEQMRIKMAQMLHQRFSPLVTAQLDSAMGVTTEHYDAKKGDYYYKEHEPNSQAFKTIFEQVAGRATENVKVSSPDGEPLIVKLDT